MFENELGSFFYWGEPSAPLAQDIFDGVCSHFDVGGVNYTSNDLMIQLPYTASRIWRVKYNAMGTANEFKAYLAAQYAAGTPVTICYKLATPTAFQATGSQPLPGLSGENVLTTNADGLTVTGRADPAQTINAMNDRIAALEDAATGG